MWTKNVIFGIMTSRIVAEVSNMKDYSFGNYICELREKKGLTQAELGLFLNVSNKAVSKWETGASYPSSELMLPLAKTLGVSIEELYVHMNGSEKGKSKLRSFLDKVFEHPYIKIAAVAGIALVCFLLFVLFGESEQKTQMLLSVAVVTPIVFFGVCMVIWIQIKNPMCPSVFLDFVELMFLVVMIIGLITQTISFIIDIRHGYTVSQSVISSALCGLTFIHSKRTR